MISTWTDRVLEKLVGSTTAYAGICEPICKLQHPCRLNDRCASYAEYRYLCTRGDCSQYIMRVCGCIVPH